MHFYHYTNNSTMHLRYSTGPGVKCPFRRGNNFLLDFLEKKTLYKSDDSYRHVSCRKHFRFIDKNIGNATLLQTEMKENIMKTDFKLKYS